MLVTPSYIPYVSSSTDASNFDKYDETPNTSPLRENNEMIDF